MKFTGLRSIIFCICTSLRFFIAAAQTSSLDSLELAIRQPGLSEKEKPALLTHLAETYRIGGNYQTAITKAEEGAKIALQLNDFTAATKALTVLTNVYVNTKQFAVLKRHADTTLLIAQKAHSHIAMAYGYYAQALLYNAIDNAEEVTKYAQMGLKELDQQPDPYISAKIYYQLYAVNTRWDNVRNVNIYSEKATENALQAADYNLLCNCYIARSIALDYNYNISKSTDQRDSILYYLRKVEALYKQYPAYVAKKTYAIACINTADYYSKYFPETDQEAVTHAIQYANMAQAVLKDAYNGQEVLASSLGILSGYAMKRKDFPLAESYLMQAYAMMKAEDTPYYYTLVNVVTSLVHLYEQTSNYPRALEFQKKVTEYTNKLFDEKQALNAQKLEIQYETEKKNNELQMLKQQEQYRRMQNYLYIGMAIIALLGLIFMFLSYYFKLRYSLQREKQLELEKQEAELQMKLEKEEQSRLRAEQQLLEAQQQQLQKEAMVNLLQLEHKKEMLSQIKEKLSDNNLVNINKIWNEELLLDNDFEDVKLQIQQVHPDFFNLLNERMQQKLTPLDLKLCAYLHLKMDTKKIAQILHIEPKSVRMSRYRIKQKLGLAKEEDLNVFLQNLG